MSSQPVTINVPENVYSQIQNAAKRSHRSVDQVLAEAVIAVAPILESGSDQLKSALAQLAYLNDAALWQLARSNLSQVQKERLEELHYKQQSTGLSSDEKEEEQALLAFYRETQLVRAQAIALLKQRNYDVSDPNQFHPFF
jgi:hypothetical protein